MTERRSKGGREVPNVCAGPFGAVYDFYIERPRLMQVVGRALWGIDASILYAQMKPIGEAGAGAVIADVPCGGGVAFRALAPEQEVRYLAGDLSPKMLRRAQRRAERRGLAQVEVGEADMTSLPYGNAEVDLFLSFSGLHMIPEPGKAVGEIARCLKPGGRLVGTTFLDGGSLRARTAFKLGGFQGHAVPPAREQLAALLAESGLTEVRLGTERGFTSFTALKPLTSGTGS
jgi:ubiquinone/menaquinone biosynthesis C-methylase UbiE